MSPASYLSVTAVLQGVINRLSMCKRQFLRIRLALIPVVMIVVLSGCMPGNIIGFADGWNPVVINDDRVYVASRDGSVLALDSSSSDIIWSYDGDDDGIGIAFGTPAVGDKLIYIGGASRDGESGILTALQKHRTWENSSNRIEVSNGEWEQRFPDGALIGGAVIANGLVLIGSEDGNFYAFDAEDGSRIWSFATEGKKENLGKDQRIWSTPVVSGDTVYFGAMDDYIYALSLEVGLNARERLLWKYKTEGAVNSPMLLINDVLVAGSFDRKLYALDTRNAGQLLWSFDSDAWFWAGPVSDGSMIYASSMDGKIYALPLDRKSNQEPAWIRDVGEPIVSTPFISESKLVVATDKGKLFMLSTVDGILEESPMETGESIRSSLSGESGSDNPRVYFGDDGNKVRSVDLTRWRIRWSVDIEKR